jgi:chromosome transmission fidelity protein 18
MCCSRHARSDERQTDQGDSGAKLTCCRDRAGRSWRSSDDGPQSQDPAICKAQILIHKLVPFQINGERFDHRRVGRRVQFKTMLEGVYGHRCASKLPSMDSSSLPSSSPPFDPAVHLHSQPDHDPVLPPSGSNSDDLEALHVQQEEITKAKSKAGIVIQHRAWKVNDALRSDEIFNPETPVKGGIPILEPVSNSVEKTQVHALLRHKMPYSSSPVLYPQSSSPPVAGQKRKLFQSPKTNEHKKKKLFGGFIDAEGNKENEVELGRATHAAQKQFLQFQNADTEESKWPTSATDKVIKPFGVTSSRSRSPSLPPMPRLSTNNRPAQTISVRTSAGQQLEIPLRTKSVQLSYEQTIAQRSITAAGRAKKAYYGIEIHQLLDDVAHQDTIDKAQAAVKQNKLAVTSIETMIPEERRSSKVKHRDQMWTEKYRARKFTDLVGDERTHRAVLRWLKAWDAIVFPGSSKPKTKKGAQETPNEDRQQHRKILLLTGPPGLGKTTLAHVCAKQAGYEVLEINASDDRSRDVVKGRIKDALGTETVRGIKEQNQARKAGRPVCVVVDEVDGVVTGSSGSGGEGGFMKALIDLVQLGEKNTTYAAGQEAHAQSRKGKATRFRFLRPLILVCNDVYAPSLRPLRNSSLAEIVHIRNPPLDKVITRLKQVFEKEGIPCDGDAVRRICESTWGLGSRKQGGTSRRGAGEGDIRSVLVQGEWVAHKLRASMGPSGNLRLTRKWVESHVTSGDGQSGTNGRGLGRGGTREVVERVFLEGAGLPNLPKTESADDARIVLDTKKISIGVVDLRKRAAINSLREMVDTCGDHDRLMTDCFAAWPTQVFQDDTCLSKPNAGYDWLCFHDRLSSRVFSGQEWELNPYLSSSICAFHHLFANVDKGAKSWDENNGKEEEELDVHPFSGPRADFAAYESEKQTRAVLTEFQSNFSAPLLRLFRSTDAIATELVPNVANMLAPDVKPVVVGGSAGFGSVASVRKQSEKSCIQNSVRVMGCLNISFEKARVEIEGGGAHSHGGFVYRMEP